MNSTVPDDETVLTFEEATPAAVAALLDTRPPDLPGVSLSWTELLSRASTAGVGDEIGEVRTISDWDRVPTGPPLRVIAIKEEAADVIRFATTAALDHLQVGAVHGILLGPGDDQADVRVGTLHVERSAREVWVQPRVSGGVG